MFRGFHKQSASFTDKEVEGKKRKKRLLRDTMEKDQEEEGTLSYKLWLLWKRSPDAISHLKKNIKMAPILFSVDNIV